MRKKASTKKLITWLFLSGIIFFASTAFANLPLFDAQEDILEQKIEVAPKANNYIEQIANELGKNRKKEKKDIINTYCEVILNDKNYQVVGQSNQQIMYDPHQSMFVLSLCYSSNNKYESNFPYLQNEEGLYYKKYQLSGFGMPTREGGSCSFTGDMNNCKFYKYIPDIFNEIINDYVNIKQANILGVENPDFSKTKLEKQANNLVKKRFFNRMLCDTEWEKDSMCYYPKTMKKVKTFIQQSAKLINKSKVINYKQIYKDSTNEDKTKLCAKVWTIDLGTYNILMCGLTPTTEDINHMHSFINILYNELFYYRLFTVYYTNNLRHSNKLWPDTEVTKAKMKQNEYADKFMRELERSEDAIELSITMLTDMNNTYPLHIGFMLYQEDLIGLRKELVKIVTPIATLYDKLRNAQEQKS